MAGWSVAVAETLVAGGESVTLFTALTAISLASFGIKGFLTSESLAVWEP